jgi:3-oxoacyl-[acyl-carrier protein] reductase
VAAEIAGVGGSAAHWALDVADAEMIEAVVAAVVARFGGLDIIVNNAGAARSLPVDDPQYDDSFAWHLSVLLAAHQRIIRAALPALRRSDAARIINIASTEALGATKGLSAYSAAKAGVVGLTRSLAVELGREGITVNCICPGPIETGMTAGVDEADKTVYARRRTALHRYGDPAEVAHISLSLALPAASYITGAVIPVDGGLMARNA